MKHDDLLYSLIEFVDPNSFITGSFLVNPDTAQDIDVVMVHSHNIPDRLSLVGFTQTNDDKYKKGGVAKTIRSTWRQGVYNIIVVHDEIAAALWRAFSNVIAHKDYQFTNKKDRIYLHELITKDYKFDFKG